MFEQTSRQLLDFIQRSPSCFHAVANFQSLLEEAGFTPCTRAVPGS